MPTAAKFIAAIVFGFIAWVAAGLMIKYFPEGMSPGYFAEICTAVGIVMGWTISGRNAGFGMRAGAGYGLTSMAATVFWCLFIFAGYEMYERSIGLRYEGPVTALLDAVQLFIAYGLSMAKWDVVVWLVVGALFGGWVTERTARNWS